MVGKAGVQASTSELRARVVDLGREAIREMEIAADSIDAGTADTLVWRNTLYLRLSTVSAIEEAVLREDPAISMLDLWALRVQMSDYLASPAGSEAFGAGIPIAERATARQVERWDATATAIGAQLTQDDRDRIESWARAHPIDRLPFTRSSLAGPLARTLREKQSSIGETMGGMQESMDRLEYRVSLANEFAIKQATWLSRLAALNLRRSPEAVELMGTLESTHSLVDDAPGLVEHERTAMLAEIDRQRLETLETLAKEREILLGAVASERALILDAVNEQRRRVMEEADSMRVRLVADEIRVVDHLMLRVAELLGVLLLGAAALLLLWRRRPARSTSL